MLCGGNFFWQLSQLAKKGLKGCQLATSSRQGEKRASVRGFLGEEIQEITFFSLFSFFLSARR
jgi:hypothetical protein